MQKYTSGRISYIYIICGILWIVFSDYLLNHWFYPDVLWAQSLKGIAYVVITGIFLHGLLSREGKQIVQAEQRARHSEERFREIFQHANDGIVIFSLDERHQVRYLASNLLFHQMTGYSEAELAATPLPDYIRFAPNSSGLLALAHNDHFIEELELHTKRGGITLVEVNAKPFRKGSETEIVAIFRDIQDRKQAEETVRFLANHDYLTNLPNPRMFYEQVDEILRTQVEFTLFVVKIEQFKLLQETLGRTNVTRLVQMVADRLKRAFDGDSLICRIDNEVFKIICSGKQAGIAVSLIEQQFEQPLLIVKDEFRLNTRIGAARYPKDGADLETLIHFAYFSLEHPEEFNDSRLINDHLNTQFGRKLQMEHELQYAVRREQLRLLYQPQILTATKEVVAVEALLRWHHPTLGLISPTEFIPIAEDTGVIVSIGEWVLFEACKKAKEMHNEHGLQLRVAVNISIRQFMQSNFVDVVRHAIESTGIDPQLLTLEITESMTMNVESAIRILRDLKGLGVKVSIDDFGTGFSSLAYLKHFAIDELKIDRAFIQDLIERKKDRRILKTIISLAHALNLKVVAEGIENVSQYQCLKNLECDLMQGYLFSPPIEFEALISQVKT